ncbi:MAG: DNA cytosine methyltransferase [Eggerthellaceae bacterium]|nr:DNA cytosine methyltransferase [Eggerthellaceae bacterium]
MRYISLFSGIEAASVAWEPLGFEPVAFSEIDPFCSQLLAKRFPSVPNLGDISIIDWRSYHGDIDLIVGGSPCQAFSVAGPRTGLMDERSALMLEYVRAVREVKPTWCVWENVPGVLSQDKGRAFATLQGELENCGYSLAWRVLDAQFFGVAQRRRRVFLVGHSDPRCAAAVLFERESLLGSYHSSQEARKAFAETARERTREASSCITGTLDLYENHGKDARVKGPMDTCPTITALYGTGGNNTPLIHEQAPPPPAYALVGNIIGRKPENGGNGTGFSEELCYTLTAMDNHAVCQMTSADIHEYTGRTCEPFVMDSGQTNAAVMEGLCPSQTARQHKNPPILFDESFCASNNREYVGALCARDGKGVGSQYVSEGKVITYEKSPLVPAASPEPSFRTVVRRLMPVECERLQGFPDDWTLIEWNGKPADKCPDSRRYKALGNSMAVPVMKWIGERIQLVDKLYEEKGHPLLKAS